MKTINNIHPMEELKGRLINILKVIPSHSNVYYIDYPVHGNGGDMLIMKGTEQFFKDNQINVRMRFNALDFPENLFIPNDCIIVLHGGGNFGDIYPLHQRLRERVVMRYPNHRIVILPQTVYYQNDSEYSKTATLFNQHKDLHIYVRDNQGFELAKKKFLNCYVYLSPDMAHQLWPISSPKQINRDTLYFLRTDVEVGEDQNNIGNKTYEDSKDWKNLFTTFDNKLIKLFSKIFIIKKLVGNKLPIEKLWYKFTDHLLNKKAIKLFSSYRVIKTSRLHGHILSCLMDKENILIDNSYGKNSSYYYTWTHRCKNTQITVNK